MNSNYSPTRQIGLLSAHPGPTSRVVIVGGGASGALMALHLARKSLQTEVILVEKAGRPGRGLAYATTCAEHVVNVLPDRLTAFHDDPAHFVRWLHQNGKLPPDEAFAFVPRHVVGDYLAEMLETAGPNLTLIQDEVTALDDTGAGAEISLKSSPPVFADAVILATGHDWVRKAQAPKTIPPDAPVTILGTSLSMVDRWLSLRAVGHTGQITATSRRGLLPHCHAICERLELDPSAVPIGQPVSTVLRWARRLSAAQPDWRSAIDAIRPFVQRLWQGWTIEERARFLRHVRPYWDIHRHRLAPAVHSRLALELRNGTLRIARSPAFTDAPYIFDCRGLLPAWEEIGRTLIGHLLRVGDARPDALGLGLDVTSDCNLIGADGTVSDRTYAIGPLTRGRFWEIEAIPEIRAQCADLAGRLRREWTPPVRQGSTSKPQRIMSA